VSGPIDIDDLDGFFALAQEAWAAADAGNPAPLAAISAPEVVFQPYMASIDTPIVRGRDELERWNTESHEAFELHRTLESVERIGDRLLCDAHVSMRARTGGAEVEQKMFGPAEIENGRLKWFAIVPDREAALALIAQRGGPDASQ
jgi:hypothetical protein